MSLSPSRFYARSFAIATVVVLGGLLFQVLHPFLSPALWAALLAFMLQPMTRRIRAQWNKPALAAGLVTAFAAVIIVGPVALFLFSFIRQAGELLSRFQAEADGQRLPALQLVLHFEPVQKVLAAVGEYTTLSTAQITEQATQAAQAALQRLASTGSSIVLGLFSVVSQFALAMFLLFFFARDGAGMFDAAVSLVPMSPGRKVDLIKTVGGVTKGVVLGTLITAFVQGSLIGIGFAICGLPSPLVFGAVGALASLVPVVGTTLVWVPGCLSLVALGHNGMALFLLIWSVVLVSGSDNVIRPLVVSSSSNVSTLLVFVGVLGGVGAFGFAGVFVGPVLLALVAGLLRYANESQLGRVPLSSPDLTRTALEPPPAAQPPPVASPPVEAPKPDVAP
ncbi:MAG: AI-2E family transporter [Archangium sp.]|nr:AI-2E family transporter [Archangium sp.]